jgi:hypothetical protein
MVEMPDEITAIKVALASRGVTVSDEDAAAVRSAIEGLWGLPEFSSSGSPRPPLSIHHRTFTRPRDAIAAYCTLGNGYMGRPMHHPDRKDLTPMYGVGLAILMSALAVFLHFWLRL